MKGVQKSEKNLKQRGLRLVQKSKRGLLNVLFGRTMMILLMLALQVVLLAGAFQSIQSMQWVYAALQAVNVLLIIHLVNKPTDPTIKITWILLVVVAPTVGLFLYLFAELDLGHRLLHRRLGALMQKTGAMLLDNEELRARIPEECPELAPISQYLWLNGRFDTYEHTRVEYFPSGEETLEAMLRELDRAEKFIFLEYFIIDEGEMWGRILEKLREKAAAGVEVRLIYDGTCSLFRLPYRYPKLLKKLGIQCKMFAPLRPTISTRYNNRDHRKLMVIDGRTAFTGGVNLADEYINLKQPFGHWKDVAILMQGEAVGAFTLMFLQMWNIDEKSDNYARYLYVERVAVPGAPGYVIPYGASPLTRERTGKMVYLDILNRATRYVHIMTPYLILDWEMVTALTFAARRGVEVVVMLPHIPDKRYAYALARTHYPELLEAGVRILEYTPGFMHAKVFVSDDQRAVVGTINLDYRSLCLHFECAALICDSPAVLAVEQDFRQTALRCQEIRPADLKNTPLATRAAGWLLKVLAPLM